MNTPSTDDQIGARVRAALDELTSDLGDEVAAPPALTPSPVGRRLAMAAAAVLVIGAVAGIGVNLAQRDDTGSADTLAPNSTARVTPSPSTPEPTATTPGAPAAWVVLASQDLVPGEVTVEPCCIPFPAPGPATVMAWASVDGLEDGLLLLTATPSADGTQTSLEYAANGFTADRTSELTSQVVAGSGLPYVLPDPGVTLLGFGMENAGAIVRQHYVGDRGTVTVTVGDYRGQLSPLVTYGFHRIDIPGFGIGGYRATVDGGGAYVVWQMPNGQWATLEVPPALADRTDGLVAALAPVATPPVAVGTTESSDTTSTIAVAGLPSDPADSPMAVPVEQVTGEPLPSYAPTGVDPAIGSAAPQFGGVVVDPAFPTRTLVVFTARWCPHCKAGLPTLLALETDGLPGAIAPRVDGAPATRVVLVDTASLADEADNSGYDISDYARWGHTGAVYLDRDRGDGSPGEVATAYGVAGFPFFVLVDTDGTVMRRAMGEMSETELLAFVNG